MTRTVADHLVERLREWGVEYIFSYPGDGINGILGALERTGNNPRFIQTRHEEMAAFAAVGYAKFTGKPAVCMATSGPGSIHLLNGLYDAKLDHVPVVAIMGHTARTAIGGSYQQEVDLASLVKDVSSEYSAMVMVPPQLPNALDRAMRTALDEKAPTTVIIPADVQEEPYEPPAHAFKYVPSSAPGYTAPVTVAPEEEIERAAEILNAGERVAMLIGQGARRAAAEVHEVADLTGAGVAKALLGKDVLPDTLPYVTGTIGLLGTRPTYEMMRGCDTLLIVGSNMPYSQYLPEYGQARGIQIDVEGKLIGMRYPTEVNLIGDAAETLRAMIPRLKKKRNRGWRKKIEKNVEHWWKTMEREAMVEADPINPMLIFWELNQRLPEDAILAADSGSAANWYARDLQFRGRIRGSLSGTLATMGCGVPYAIGAKFGDPDRPAIALVGDGAMQMNGMNELITIRRYYDEWDDPRLIVAVLHNNDLNQVTWELRSMGGHPKFVESQVLPDISYAGFARAIGLEGIEVDKPDDIGPAWDRALSSDIPIVLDFRCDPEIPPVPPHAELGQMIDTAKAMLKGDPERTGVVKKGIKVKAQEIFRR